MPTLWCADPHRQVSIPLANKLSSASLSRSGAVFLHVQTCGGHSAGTQKIFPFTVHKSLFRLISIEFMRMRESAGVSHTQNFARRFSVPHTDWQQLDSVPSQVPNSSLPWVTDMRTVAQYGFTGACADAAEAKALFDESCRAVETWLTSKGVANPNGNSTSEFQDGRTADFEAACQTCSFGAASRWALTESSGPSRFSTTLRLARARTALLRGVWRCVPWRLPETRHGQRVVSQSRPPRSRGIA